MLTLTEHTPAHGIPLSQQEAAALRMSVPSMTVSPSWEGGDRWDVVPGSEVGVVSTGERTVVIRPKVPLDRVMFMASYGIDGVRWQDLLAEAGTNPTLVDLMAAALVRQVRAALRRGVLQGYRTEEDALNTIRGRIRFDDQLRRRLGQTVPIEVRFDEFTEDIEPNRLLKAALWQLAHLPIRSARLRGAVGTFLSILGENVRLVPYEPRRLPTIEWTRLNVHYRPAIGLAALVLRSSSLEVHHGAVTTAGMVMNMNSVFETFVRRALRDELGLDARSFPVAATGRGVFLDDAEAVGLEPDLSWWDAGRCAFVGDVKYKRISAAGIKHPDLYQLLAYSTALRVPAGLLIYAASPDVVSASHFVAGVDKRLDVVALDLSGTPLEILGQIEEIAHRVRSMRAETLAARSTESLPAGAA